ncbi:MAG: glycosyltransferase family 2 protein [bacterium]
MDISIIILNYKSRGLLKQCLRGILLQKIPLAYEIIVVDNCSGDGTGEMMKEEFPHIRFLQSDHNGGFAQGNNLGILQSRGKYLLILNPDIAVLSNAIETMHRFMEEHPTVGLCAPKLLNPDGSVQTSCRTFPTVLTIFLRRSPIGRLPWARRRLRHFLMLEWDHASNQPVDWVLGACLMVRRTAMESVGLMDERFFLYFEDVDWCRRFWQAGFPVYYLGHDAELVHYHQRMSATNPGLSGVFSYTTRVHIVSGIKYFAKYHQQRLPERQVATEQWKHN